MKYTEIIDGLKKFAGDNEAIILALNELEEKVKDEVLDTKLSQDDIKQLLTETDEGKVAFQSLYDSKFLRWERDRLPERMKEFYETKRAEETKTDPKDEQLTELQKKIQDMEQRERKAILQSKATQFAAEHGLPSSLLADIVRGDDETAESILNTVKSELLSWRDAQVQKAVSGIPSDNGGSKNPELPVSLENLSDAELIEMSEKNPAALDAAMKME